MQRHLKVLFLKNYEKNLKDYQGRNIRSCSWVGFE